MLLQVLLMTLLVWMLVLWWQKRGMLKLWSQLKKECRILPIVEHAYLFLGGAEERMKYFQKIGTNAYKTGGLIGLWLGSRLYISVSDPEIAELVLKTCLEKDDIMKISRMLLGNGSIFAPVPIWRPRRKFLAPTFSPKNLVRFGQIFSRQSEVMLDQLKGAVGKGPFSIWKYITSYSMDSVCESTLGVKMNAQKQLDTPFLKAFEEICKLDSARICQPWLHHDAVYKMTSYYRRHVEYKAELCGFVNRIIKNKRHIMRGDKEKQPESDQHSDNLMKTFLELLIESSGGERGFTDLELQEETLVMVLAGTDTSAVGTSFTALLLALHPDIQEKAYKEIEEVFGDSTRPITPEDLPRLRYLDAVIKESLRLYPPVPIIVRKALKDIPLPSGVTVAKNCGLLINIWAIHRNPQYWGEDAAVFRPERWTDSPLKHPAAFIPFSYGPRGCLGSRYAMMSMRTAAASLLRRYRLLPAAAGERHSLLPTKFDVMMKHTHHYTLRLQARG